MEKSEPKRGLSKWKATLLASLIFAVMAQLVHGAGAYLTMSYYKDPGYFGVWSKLMMPKAGLPPPSFFAVALVFAFLTGLAYTLGYRWVSGAFGGGRLRSGIAFAFFVFLVGIIPSMLALVLLVNVPVGLVCAWAVENLVILLVGGVVIAVLKRS